VDNDFYQAILTESEVIKLFGTDWRAKSVFQESIIVDDTAYAIQAVLADIPQYSHFDFNIILQKPKIEYWGARTYVVLEEDYSAAEVTKNLNDNIEQVNPRIAEDELHGGDFLQPLTDIHLYSDLLYELKPPGDVRYLYIFSLIALIILLLTVTNYTNLSIALNSNRFREIGMRKSMGAGRSNIAIQFLMEAIILVLFAVPLVLLLLQLLIPVFNNFMEVQIANSFIDSFGYLCLLIGFAVLVGMLSGAYPALYLASLSMLKLFSKNNWSGKAARFTTRKVLITFQFVLLIALTSFTFFINRQLNFIETKDVGYKKQGVMYALVNRDNQIEFRQQLKQLAAIKEVGTGSPLGVDPYNQTTYKLEGKEEVFDDAYNMYMETVAIKAYGISTSIDEQLARNDTIFPSNAVLINETTAQRFMNLYELKKPELIGMQIIQEPEYIDEEGNIGFPVTIHGFFDDINVFSLREEVSPCFMNIYTRPVNDLTIISFDPSETANVIAAAKTAYAALDQSSPFKYEFLDENLLQLYKKEKRVGQLTVILSILAFIIAIFGLVALTSLLTALRKKEIGVRRILGASTAQIIIKFNAEYAKLVIIALLIASPAAYYVTYGWLSNFAYRIAIQPLVFIVAPAFAFVTAALAVSLITYKSVLQNPVQSLTEDQ